MEKQSLERKQEEQSPERKYAELTSYIRILSYRASSEQNEKSNSSKKFHSLLVSGPPNWVMITFAMAGLGREIFTGYCNFLS